MVCYEIDSLRFVHHAIENQRQHADNHCWQENPVTLQTKLSDAGKSANIEIVERINRQGAEGVETLNQTVEIDIAMKINRV